MNRTERFYAIEYLLRQQRVVPIAVFLERLGISRSTFTRDIEYLRDRLHAPIVWDREEGGYRFDDPPCDGPPHELPGLWFSAGELYALLAAQKLLSDLEPGILARHIAPLQARLTVLLEASGHQADEIAERVRLLSIAKRHVEPHFFSEIASALLNRKQLEIDAWNRGRDEINRRIVSPQRLIHYRDNWYLDTWCHWRDALRTFSVDCLKRMTISPDAACDIPSERLDEHLARAYGIFSGQPVDWAVLNFSAERARWVRYESWHPDQLGEDLPDGGYRLTLPFADTRELLMDILRHGRHVEVESPPSLREAVAEEANRIAKIYRD